MAFVDLTDLRIQAPEPSMPDYGVMQTPVLGGRTNRIGRLGGGHMLKLTLPPEDMEPDGRKIVARLQMAKEYGGIVAWPQVDFPVGTPGAAITVSSAVAGGRYVQITGATPRYAIRMGQALNITRNGHRYLYFAGAQTILNASGAGTVTLTRPLRTKLLGAEAVNLAKPVIEGWITGDNFGWPIDEQRNVGLSFDLMERA